MSGTETSWPDIAHGIIIISVQQEGLIAAACWERGPWLFWFLNGASKLFVSACWSRSKLCQIKTIT